MRFCLLLRQTLQGGQRQYRLEEQRYDEQRRSDDKRYRAEKERKTSKSFHRICACDGEYDAHKTCRDTRRHNVGDLKNRAHAFYDVKARNE